MDDSLKMNSASLQKRFPTVYRDFCSKHDIVLSADTVMTWGVDVSRGTSAVRIKQKVPTKVFIWVNLIWSEIKIQRVIHFSPQKNTFLEDDFAQSYKFDSKLLISFLEKFLSENGYTWGMEIDILTEAPRWCGFAFSGVLSVLFTYLIFILTGKLQGSELYNPSECIKHPIFESLYLTSLSLSQCISGGKKRGWATNYAIMMPDTPLPILCFTGGTDHSKISDPSRDSTQEIVVPAYKDTLLNFLKIDSNIREFTIDYGIISTGLEYNYKTIESTRESIKRENEKMTAFANDICQSLPIKESEKEYFSWLLDFDRQDVFRKTIDDTNIKIIEWFSYLLKNQHDDGGVDAFIQTIKNVGLTSFAYQKENRLFFAIQHFFYSYRHFLDEEIGILPFNTGKSWGSLLFVMKGDKSHETITRVIQHLQDAGELISLDYASWRDGYSSDGVRLEQYVQQGIYSEYAKERNIVFSDSQGNHYFWEY